MQYNNVFYTTVQVRSAPTRQLLPWQCVIFPVSLDFIVCFLFFFSSSICFLVFKVVCLCSHYYLSAQQFIYNLCFQENNEFACLVCISLKNIGVGHKIQSPSVIPMTVSFLMLLMHYFCLFCFIELFFYDHQCTFVGPSSILNC